MKEIIRDGEKFYELSELELIELRNRLMHIYMRVDDIFADRAVSDDIKDNVTEARGILRVTEGRYTFNKSSVEMSEDEWKKIRGGAMSYGDVEQKLETVKSSLEDAISDVDCNLSGRIYDLGEKIDEMYEFYENFPADWTLEKQLKELAEETVKTAVEPIVKRQALLNMNIDDLRRDLKLWVGNDERTSTETDDRLDKLEKTIAQLEKQMNNAITDIALLRKARYFH